MSVTKTFSMSQNSPGFSETYGIDVLNTFTY